MVANGKWIFLGPEYCHQELMVCGICEIPLPPKSRHCRALDPKAMGFSNPSGCTCAINVEKCICHILLATYLLSLYTWYEDSSYYMVVGSWLIQFSEFLFPPPDRVANRSSGVGNGNGFTSKIGLSPYNIVPSSFGTGTSGAAQPLFHWLNDSLSLQLVQLHSWGHMAQNVDGKTLDPGFTFSLACTSVLVPNPSSAICMILPW